MRIIILSSIGLAIAYWLDRHYCNGMYSASLADMLHHIAIGFT
jgi:hypothetical protein